RVDRTVPGTVVQHLVPGGRRVHDQRIAVARGARGRAHDLRHVARARAAIDAVSGLACIGGAAGGGIALRMTGATYALRATGIVKTFDEDAFSVTVLKGAYLRVQPGEQVAIVGASGSGKSTLLHILGGLDQPPAGQVEIDGQDVGKLSEAERSEFRNQKLGFIYQFHHLLPEFTAIENVAMPLLLRRGSTRAAIDQAT